MKVGIIGSGAVGQTLATAFLAEGHEVMLGTRNPDKEEVKNWKSKNPKGQTGTFGATAQFGELLVLSVAGSAAESAVQQAGLSNFAGKVVIDTTNPIAAAPPENGVLKFFTEQNSSLMEKIQGLIPEANVVKAFNSVGNALMYKPQLPGGKPTMFICGNNTAARTTVTDILTAFGWETEDMGTAVAARAIEPLCILWCIPGFLQNRWNHAFKLLKP
ncbi:NAD(P)-binding domain-containing protein [Chitinophaga polysaccharea]|uniref:NADPH-dependent F420 reductase n=1 Tax=Chitinophaga TaxID=79328 RepID=UPI0014555A2E|nr:MULTISPECIES: NAD(P)-binding domain-containing protein [Chitinophaga]NLR62636.1 NAD(P)-binding domain-containing protein [Chitinophaga polysaccharea]NLU91444.1 NAD(P)-binding domain-containing protein [Chitinophaga sp. Ak27]